MFRSAVSALGNGTKFFRYASRYAAQFEFPGAPIYESLPHFYKSDPKLLDAVEGLKPVEMLHRSYLKIQPVSTMKRDATVGTVFPSLINSLARN